MRDLASLFGSGLFFVPFVYILLYLFLERNLSRHPLIRMSLKYFTVLTGLVLIVYAFTLPADLTVLMPSRGTAKNSVPASIFLVIVGVATMALPFYSKYIKLSNRNE